MNVLRKFVGIALGLLSLIAGCGYINETHFHADYGVAVPPPPPPIPHDATVTLDDFSYTPASPVSPGDTLEFTATTNKPTNTGWLSVIVGDPTQLSVWLKDDGIAPDDVANDGIWHGEHEIPTDAAPAQGMPTIARLNWQDGAEGQEIAGEDLTIEEGE